MPFKRFGIRYNIPNSVCHPLGRDKLFIKPITCSEWDFKVIIPVRISWSPPIRIDFRSSNTKNFDSKAEM